MSASTNPTVTPVGPAGLTPALPRHLTRLPWKVCAIGNDTTSNNNTKTFASMAFSISIWGDTVASFEIFSNWSWFCEMRETASTFKEVSFTTTSGLTSWSGWTGQRAPGREEPAHVPAHCGEVFESPPTPRPPRAREAQIGGRAPRLGRFLATSSAAYPRVLPGARARPDAGSGLLKRRRTPAGASSRPLPRRTRTAAGRAQPAGRGRSAPSARATFGRELHEPEVSSRNKR